MPTVRLIPSTYQLSNTSYLSISNASNMYHNTDNTTHSTITNSRTSTTSYYIYLRGFNFDDIPNAAIISDFSVKLKAYESGVSTSYYPQLCNGTTTISGQTTALGTSATVKEFTGITADWETISGYGNNFGIRINCRRASRNTTSYVYICGAEIEVTYTIPASRTITTTLSGNGTISPSGNTTVYDGEEFELTITPNNTSDTVTATLNGTDITSSLVGHGTETNANTVLGDYHLVSGGFNGSGATWFSEIVGNGHDTTSTTTSNYYSSSSSSTAVFTYDMGITLPSNANITRCYCLVNGHAESNSNDNEYMCAMLISGSTELSEEINFKNISTSNTTATLECETLPTVSQLAAMKLQCRLGYYGGAINGATLYVEYDISGGNITHYTYTMTVSGNATIVVTIGGSAAPTNKIHVKINGVWKTAAKAYKKINGVWVQQTDLTNVFQSGINYKKG